MENISELYIRKFPLKLKQFNKPLPFPEYLIPLIGDKKKVLIGELGAGPICTIGKVLEGVNVDIEASDVLADEYQKLWWEHKAEPIIPIFYEDMENLSYPNDYFDIVHCINALDHTPNYQKAIDEMFRVCKEGGYIYLRHGLGQKKRFGGHHHWNMEEVELPGFDVRIIDNGDYKKNFIEHIWRKI